MPADGIIPIIFHAVQEVFATFAGAEIFSGISLMTILLMFIGLEIALWLVDYLMTNSMPGAGSSSGGEPGIGSEAYKPEGWQGEWRY